MSTYRSMSRRGLYRSRRGLILGVCRGIADYFDFSAFWARGAAVILFLITGFWPAIGLYILAAFLMKSEPVTDGGAGSKEARDTRYTDSKHEAAERLKRKWRHLEKRIRKMEDKVTSREFDWNSRFQG